MRRFEFSSGSSNKFWAIEESGLGFTVRYGKIGMDGREQKKQFESEEKAKTEAEKLIRAKVKKGYVEVGAEVGDAPKGEAPAKKAPATKKAATKKAATTKATENGAGGKPDPVGNVDYTRSFVEWTAELKKRVLAQRGDPPPKRKRSAIKPAKLLETGAAQLKKHPGSWKRGAELATPEEAALLERVRSRLKGTEPGTFDAQLETATALVCATFAPWGAKRRAVLERFVQFWAQSYGVPAAAEALFGTTTITFSTYTDRENAYRFLLDGSGRGGHGLARQMEPWEALRALLASCDDASFAEARDWLVKAFGSAPNEPPLARNRVAFVLPQEQGLRREVTADNWAGPLVACASDAVEAERFIKANRSSAFPYLLTMVRRVGIDALPVMLKEAPNAHDADQQREWVRAMSVFVGDEPAKAMLAYVGTKSVRALLGAYFERHPALALRVVPDVLATLRKKADKQAASAILESARITQEAGAVEAGPAADPSDLPSVLQSPSWRQKRKKSKDVVLELRMILTEGELRMDEATRRSLVRPPNKRYVDSRNDQLTDAVKGNGDGRLWALTCVGDDELAFSFVQKIDRWVWSHAEVLRPIIARLGERIVPYVAKLAGDSNEAIEGTVEVGHSTLAPLMAAAHLRRKTRRLAQGWMMTFPSHAAMGLIPPLLGADKKARKAAAAAVRFLKARGHSDAVRAAGKAYGDEAAAAVDAFVDMNPLLEAPTKPPKLPPWLDVRRLPPLELKAGGNLSDESKQHVAEMLVFSPNAPAYVGLSHVRDACTQESLDAFAQALCNGWVAAGAKSAWTWAVYSVGHFGGDESARWLVKRIDGWASDGSKSIAVVGLEALAMIGSDVALMPLGRWSRKGRQWLKEGAKEILDNVAAERGLSTDELEDRTAPTLGLQEDGTLMLDYGPRQFKVTFDEQLRPLIFDSEGARVAKIPPARKTDDAALAKEAKKTWKTLKKDADTLAKAQVERLERAMAMKRQWSAREFEEYIMKHPLLCHLARRLVFGVYADGEVTGSFRVGEDGTLADSADDDWTLPSDAQVGVAHPLDLGEDACATWGELFADYELLQPFTQLSRPVFTITDDEKNARVLERGKDIKAYTGRLFALRQRGWRFDGDPYYLDYAYKEIAPGMSVSLSWEGGIDIQQPKMEEHPIRSIRLQSQDKTFGDLDPVAFSELVADVESLRGG